ncbi:MAG: hypothetical protein GY698_17760, partial [Actinomycetia bacterium]|nr:hypothetical protein [Actinomycetes bacterium]
SLSIADRQPLMDDDSSTILGDTYVNAPPILSNLDGNPTFIEGGTPVVLDADVTVSDAGLDVLNGGSGDYDGASVTLVRDISANANDVFSFNEGNDITLVGGTFLQKSGATIAIFDTTTIPGELKVTFTNSGGQTPTSADIDYILQQITYANSSDTPPASVQIDWSF